MIPLIIQAIEDPDDRAFMEEMYLTNRWIMRWAIWRVVKNQWETEDILQTSLEKLIKKLDKLRTMERKNVLNYAVKTCRREALTFMRKSARLEYMDNDALDIYEDESDNPEVMFLTKERLERTYAAWQKLDEGSQDIISWKYTLRMSDAEIAALLGIKPDSVRMKVKRARDKLSRLVMEE